MICWKVIIWGVKRWDRVPKQLHDKVKAASSGGMQSSSRGTSLDKVCWEVLLLPTPIHNKLRVQQGCTGTAVPGGGQVCHMEPLARLQSVKLHRKSSDSSGYCGSPSSFLSFSTELDSECTDSEFMAGSQIPPHNANNSARNRDSGAWMETPLWGFQWNRIVHHALWNCSTSLWNTRLYYTIYLQWNSMVRHHCETVVDHCETL